MLVDVSGFYELPATCDDADFPRAATKRRAFCERFGVLEMLKSKTCRRIDSEPLETRTRKARPEPQHDGGASELSIEQGAGC